MQSALSPPLELLVQQGPRPTIWYAGFLKHRFKGLMDLSKGWSIRRTPLPAWKKKPPLKTSLQQQTRSTLHQEEPEITVPFQYTEIKYWHENLIYRVLGVCNHFGSVTAADAQHSLNQVLVSVCDSRCWALLGKSAGHWVTYQKATVKSHSQSCKKPNEAPASSLEHKLFFKLSGKRRQRKHWDPQRISSPGLWAPRRDEQLVS